MATKSENVAREFSDWLNNMGLDKKSFIEAMKREHRTLQQVFTGLCLDWLYAIADAEFFDLRNEASVLAARKVKEALGDGGNYLPFI